MLELFARKPDALDLAEGAHLTPVPIDEEGSNLSAILLDDSYYAFLHSGKKTIEDISIVGAEHLIPLKARAWLDLSARKAKGEKVDSGDIKKQKNDVFRLYRVIDPAFKADIPGDVRTDMGIFLDSMASESIDLKSLGIKNKNLESILEELRRLYVGD